MSEDRRKILDMLANGQIDPNAAERLLDKLAGGDQTARATPVDGDLVPRAPRHLRICGQAEKGRFDIRIPLALIKTGIKLEAMLPNGTREELEGHGVDLGQFGGMAADEVVEALGELRINVEGDAGEQVVIFCE